PPRTISSAIGVARNSRRRDPARAASTLATPYMVGNPRTESLVAISEIDDQLADHFRRVHAGRLLTTADHVQLSTNVVEGSGRRGAGGEPGRAKRAWRGLQVAFPLHQRLCPTPDSDEPQHVSAVSLERGRLARSRAADEFPFEGGVA